MRARSTQSLPRAPRSTAADYLCYRGRFPHGSQGIWAFTAALATAQDCPTPQSGKVGFVVERGDRQKSEIFLAEGDVVHTVMRYDRAMVLETTQHEGLFQLDRLESGRVGKGAFFAPCPPGLRWARFALPTLRAVVNKAAAPAQA